MKLSQLLRDIAYEISEIRAAIQQFVEPDHDGLAVVISCFSYQRRVPLLCCDLEMFVHLAEPLLKILLGGFEARFQRRQIPSAFPRFAQFVERLVQLKNFFEKFWRSLLLVLTFFA